MRQVSHTPVTVVVSMGGGVFGIWGQRLSYESTSERGDWWVGAQVALVSLPYRHS